MEFGRWATLAGLASALSQFLDGYEWTGNLDAFNDILRGGFGTPEGGFVLRWVNSDVSAERLGAPLYLTLLEIIRTHGPGGDEAEDGVELELA